MSDEIRGYYPIETKPLTDRERQGLGSADGQYPLHLNDPDGRRAVKAVLIFDEWFPRTIAGLSDGEYRKLETELRKAFRQITREETQAKARRCNRTVRDGG